MNAENFKDYLTQVSKLYQLPLEELKSLVLQYAYCQNLQQLMAQKAQLDHRPDAGQYLEKAAMYSIDRAFLFRKLRELLEERPVTEDSFLLAEEFLELKDLNQLQPEPEPVFDHLIPEAAAPEQQPSLYFELPPFDSPSDETPEPVAPSTPILPDEEPLPSTEPSEEPAVAAPLSFADEAIILTVASSLYAASPWLKPPAGPRAPKKSKPGPQPKTSFPSWVKQFQPAHRSLHIEDLMETVNSESGRKAPAPSPSSGMLFEQQARQSLIENRALATETLAELLVSQMQYEKAIETYRRLSLIFPEKSALFASKIEEIKKMSL